MATLAPTAGPALILPLMIVSSGNGTWLVMLLATLAVICIGCEVNTFARRYSSPGLLYTFVAEGLPRAAISAAWALLFAYLGTGISCAVGAVIYSYSLFFPHVAIARGGVVLIAVVVCDDLLAAGVVEISLAVAYKTLHVPSSQDPAISALRHGRH